MNKTILTSLLALGLLTPMAVDAQSRSSVEPFNPQGLDYSNVYLDLPDYDEPFQRDGRRVPAEQILAVVPGVKAERVRELLGQPLSTGHGERGPEWDYNLKLDIADEDFIVCQYKVVFEADNETVRETSFRRYQCKLAAVAAPSPVPQTFDLSGDFLFDFDKDVLTAQGVEVLDQLARQQSGSNSTIDIVGHTDRLGSVAYNQNLSERRARTVADYLLAQGIARDRLTTSGRGKAEQVKQCEGNVSTPELRACLHPNRRVAFTITPVN